MMPALRTYFPAIFSRPLALLTLLLALAAIAQETKACASDATEQCCESSVSQLSLVDAPAAAYVQDRAENAGACRTADCDAHDDATRDCDCGGDCGEECDTCCFDASLRSMTTAARPHTVIPSSRFGFAPVPSPIDTIRPVAELPPRA